MRTTIFAALAILIAMPLSADIREAAEIKMEQFKKAHPKARFHGQQYYDYEGFFEIDGTADFIYGTTLATGKTAMASAWSLCEQLEGIYADEVGTLVPGAEIGVMWNKTANSHRFSTFRFQQTVNGIPVYKSGIGFLVRNEANYPVVMSSNNFKEMQGFDAAAGAFVPPVATDVMLQNAGKVLEFAAPFQGAKVARSVLDNARVDRKLLPVTARDQELVIWAGISNVKVDNPELAIKFIAERGSSNDPSTHQKHLVIASVANGQVLYSLNQIVADVDGTVSGRASDGVGALECHPEVAVGLPYAEVEILGGSSTFADANGNFSLPSGNGNFTVRSPLRGQYFSVEDDTDGGNTPFLDFNVASPGSVDILHNPNATEFATSNVNCYLHANIVRDFVLSFEPNFPTIANQNFFRITSNNNNISGITSCNATYSGDAINFMRNIGDCNNTSIPDVVYHEYGHHLVAVTGNSQGQFGEGSGDTIGILIEDNPDLALGFFEGSCNSGIRSANNFREYPCFDQFSPHDCGQLLAGSVWDVVNEIRTVDPSNARDITANLFIGMLIVRGQMGGSSMIGPEITLIFLELDDDDATIGNGTPHYPQIAAAFNAHNMMAPELDPVILQTPNGTPTLISPSGGDSFVVTVDDSSSSAVAGSGTLHYDDGSGFVSIPMQVVDADTYNAVFPATACGANVQYYVSVDAQNGETATIPSDAPSATLQAISAVGLATTFLDSFDTDTGWTVTGNASDGQWQRGVPNNGDRGDPSADAESTGAGNCYVTDNGNTGGNDNSDVDGGSTTLTSPILDASTEGDDVAFLSYYRWYSNDFGQSPNADTFVIEISNNGGTSWVSLETVGPAGPEVSGGWFQKQFRIADFVTPTDNMRVRFTASDLGDGSVVEAAVDGVEIVVVDCSEEFLLGDVNRDGSVNLLDVGPFVELISSGEYLPEADINGDGVVNLLDIEGFIALLNGG
ncbi:MAG: dockerin type I domain-containing protein [Planctomycetota bacterium]